MLGLFMVKRTVVRSRLIMNDKVLEIMERVANEMLSMSDEEHRAIRTNPKYDVEIPGVTLDEDDPMWDEIEKMSLMEYKYED